MSSSIELSDSSTRFAWLARACTPGATGKSFLWTGLLFHGILSGGVSVALFDEKICARLVAYCCSFNCFPSRFWRLRVISSYVWNKRRFLRKEALDSVTFCSNMAYRCLQYLRSLKQMSCVRMGTNSGIFSFNLPSTTSNTVDGPCSTVERSGLVRWASMPVSVSISFRTLSTSFR